MHNSHLYNPFGGHPIAFSDFLYIFNWRTLPSLIQFLYLIDLRTLPSLIQLLCAHNALPNPKCIQFTCQINSSSAIALAWLGLELARTNERQVQTIHKH